MDAWLKDCNRDYELPQSQSCLLLFFLYTFLCTNMAPKYCSNCSAAQCINTCPQCSALVEDTKTTYIYNSYTYSTVLHHSSVYGCIFCSAVTASLTFTALCCCVPIALSFTSEGDDPMPLLYGCELELVVERRLYSQSISGVIVHQEES